jgi:hypothetical protein
VSTRKNVMDNDFLSCSDMIQVSSLTNRIDSKPSVWYDLMLTLLSQKHVVRMILSHYSLIHMNDCITGIRMGYTVSFLVE